MRARLSAIGVDVPLIAAFRPYTTDSPAVSWPGAPSVLGDARAAGEQTDPGPPGAGDPVSDPVGVLAQAAVDLLDEVVALRCRLGSP
jgi:hypothetical protein